MGSSPTEPTIPESETMKFSMPWRPWRRPSPWENDPVSHAIHIRQECPDCGGKWFLYGPQGGVSQNIECANDNCRSRFNVTMGFHVERIGSGRED